MRYAQPQGWRNFAAAFLALLLSTLALVYPRESAAHAAFPQFLIVDYHPVSKTRVPGTPDNHPLYDYVYRVDVRNNGAQAVNVRGTMTSKRRSVTVIDGAASFGTVPARQEKASEDTIGVRAGKFFDRRLDRQVFTGGRWRFEEDGYDPEDQSIGGLLGLNTLWFPQVLDSIYDLKFALIFDWSITSGGDSQAPVIANTAPNGNLADSRPVISATYSDAQGAVPTNRVTLSLDGVNVTSTATVTATSISYRPAAPLPDGSHRVLLTVGDSAGNLATATWAFTVDTQPPDITSPAPTNVSNASPRATISAQFSDETGVDLTSVRLRVDGSDVTAAATTNGNGITYRPPVPLSDGNHTVQLHVADSVGNPADLSWSFGVDASGPSITALQPASGSEIPADALPVISASFADAGSGIDVSSVRFFVDGQDVRSQAQVSASGASYTPSSPLVEGGHNVTLSAADANGNITSVIWSFVTRTPPQITNVAPSDVTLNANATVVITAQYTDIGSGIDTAGVVLSLDGVDVTAATQVNATGLTFTPTTALAQGLHIAVLTVRDKAGNTSARTWRFTIDTGLPVVTDEQPRDVLVNSLRPTISAKFRDTGAAAGSGIDASQTRLWVNGTNVTSLAQINTGVLPHEITYVPAQDLPSGTQTIRLRVVDLAGNPVEDIWSFVIDVEGPAVVDLSPADGATLAADAPVTLRGSFVAQGSGVNVSSVVVTLDGQNITSQANVTASGFVRAGSQPLSEGSHTLTVRVSDTVGNETVRSSTFLVSSPPVISAQSPIDDFLPGGAQPIISASLSDVGSGIDTASVRVYVNQTDVTAATQITASAISYTLPQALPDATHTVRVVVRDLAGNLTESSWRFGTATIPVITAVSPRDVMLPVGSRPTITASYSDSRVGIDPQSVHLFVNGQDVTAASTVTAGGISYTPPANLASGPYTLYLEIANQTNATATSAWGFDVDEPKTYSVEVSPAEGAVVDAPQVDVVATVRANKSFARLLSVNGHELALSNTGEDGAQTYAGGVLLKDGLNSLVVTATFEDGEVRSTTRQVTFNAPPRVTITSPADKATLGRVNPTSPGDLTGNVERPVTITGLVSRPVVSVMINQQAAVLTNGGTEFRFDNFFAREGVNALTAVATDANGRVGSAALTLSVDQTAPILTTEAPADGAVTSSARIDVRGMVNDAVEGLLGAPEPTVTVNGRPAQVFDRYYLAADVPLQIGANDINIVATDQFGNARTSTLRVSRIAVGSARLTLLSGNHQTGHAVTELPQPLSVIALDANGAPLANRAVRFDVMRGTGTVSLQQGQPTRVNGATLARNLEVTTDAQGQARVWFTLGKQSGPGANVVKASYPDLAEAIDFVATTQREAVYKVLADTGINQFAETGSQPIELLSVVVRDREDNVLPNVPVVFNVDSGDASFHDAGGNPVRRVVLNTDKNGLTALRPTLGNTPGVVRISAQALRTETGDVNNPADLTGNATYYIQVKQAQDGPATFKGFLYTDKGDPLPGVRVSIGRTSLSSTSDSTGAFEFSDVPPGRIDLFVDGRTSSHLGKIWPSLHFESYVVRGQENQLPHPIYLPPLLMSEAKVVGGAEDVILTIPGLQGFQMKVKANSVTFPDGSRTGTLVVSPVTADRLPMAPPSGGALFGVPAWTIQPAGTRFDPPIEVRLPNSTSQPPGDNLPVVQWDHDLGQFVPMGRATVTEDGAYLVTDVGSGVTKAGWGGLCVYDPDKCGKNSTPKCDKCEKLDTSGECPTCKPDAAKDGFVVAEIGGSVGFSAPLKGIAKKLFQVFGVDVDVSVGGSGSYSSRDICCIQGPNGHGNSNEGSFEASIEAGVVVPLLPLLKKAVRIDVTGILGAIVPQAELEISGSGGATGEWNTCTHEGEAGGTIELEASFGVGFFNHGAFKYKQKNLDGSVGEHEGELTPLKIGVAGNGNIVVTHMIKSFEGEWEAMFNAFVQSKAEFGSFNWTLIDLQIPIWQGRGPISIPYQ